LIAGAVSLRFINSNQEKNVIVKILQSLSVALLLLMLGCTNQTDSPRQGSKRQKAMIRFATLPGYLPVNVGIKHGFFAEEGIDVKLVNVNGGVEAVTAAAAGEADLGCMGSPILIGAAAGIPIKIVASPPAAGQPFVLVANPRYKSFADLKGQQIIAGRPGQGTIQAFNYIARAKGFKPNDFQYADANGNAAVLAALQSDKVAAVITMELGAARAEHEGFGRVIERADKYFGHYQHSFVFATDKIIKEKPELVRAFLRAFRKGVEYARVHPEEVIHFGIQDLQQDEVAFRTVYGKELPTWDASGKVDYEGTDNAIRILKELGEIDPKNSIRAKQIIDERFLSN
jgi:NitT/TauT family transport system substrate-binding protein